MLSLNIKQSVAYIAPKFNIDSCWQLMINYTHPKQKRNFLGSYCAFKELFFRNPLKFKIIQND